MRITIRVYICDPEKARTFVGLPATHYATVDEMPHIAEYAICREHAIDDAICLALKTIGNQVRSTKLRPADVASIEVVVAE